MCHDQNLKNQRFKQIEQMLASGMNAKEWCELNKISRSTVYKWLDIYRKEQGLLDDANDRWIEVTRRKLYEKSAIVLAGPQTEESSINNNVAPLDTTANIPTTPALLNSTDIQLNIKGIYISIPEKSSSAHINKVLKAVMAL